MFFFLSCSWLLPIHWSQMWSWEWRSEWSTFFIFYYGVTYIRGLPVIHVPFTVCDQYFRLIGRSTYWLPYLYGFLTTSAGSVNAMMGLENCPSGYGVGIQLSTQWRCNFCRRSALPWPVITFDIHEAAKVYHIDRWWEMGYSVLTNTCKFSVFPLILKP